jgi:hypothetical protein
MIKSLLQKWRPPKESVSPRAAGGNDPLPEPLSASTELTCRDRTPQTTTPSLPSHILKAMKLADGFNLVLSPPKTGSTTLRKMLELMQLPGVLYKVHSLDRGLMLDAKLWQQTAALSSGRAAAFSEVKFHWKVAGLLDLYRQLQALRPEQMRAKDPRPHLLVTLREPIARYLSSLFFYVHHLYGTDGLALLTPASVLQKMQVPTEFPITIGLRTWWTLEDWVEREIVHGFGLDIMAEPFNAAQGWQVYENADFRLLVIRQENLVRSAEAIGAFYRIPPGSIPVPLANAGEENPYADAYRAVKSSIRLSADHLHEIYSGHFAQHFYTAEERRRFQDRWANKEAGI